MDTVFFVCALVGGGLLVLELVLSVLGLEDGVLHTLGIGDAPGVHAGDALQLLSVRSVSAALAFGGIGGMAMRAGGFGVPVAASVALAAGSVSAWGVATAMRAMLRLERDGTVRLGGAVGHQGQVYLSIPGARAGAGKIHVSLQGRTVECRAVSDEPLPTGAAILVVDVLDPETVVVVPTPDLGA